MKGLADLKIELAAHYNSGSVHHHNAEALHKAVPAGNADPDSSPVAAALPADKVPGKAAEPAAALQAVAAPQAADD
ncbi:hypothetical protein D3C80_2012440 [compost metagenome]